MARALSRKRLGRRSWLSAAGTRIRRRDDLRPFRGDAAHRCSCLRFRRKPPSATMGLNHTFNRPPDGNRSHRDEASRANDSRSIVSLVQRSVGPRIFAAARSTYSSTPASAQPLNARAEWARCRHGLPIASRRFLDCMGSERGGIRERTSSLDPRNAHGLEICMSDDNHASPALRGRRQRSFIACALRKGQW